MFCTFYGQRGQSYVDWEDQFLSIMAVFDVPAQFWLKLAVTSLQDAAMKTWLHHVDSRQEMAPLSWPEFHQTMELYFGNPLSHLRDFTKLEKLTCSQESLTAFIGYTREYQQLPMGLGKHDGRSTEQHVQQYIKNLPPGLKNLIVTQMVTNPDVYKTLPLGQQLDRFLTLGQTWLAASTAAQPPCNVRPAQQKLTGANRRPVRAGQKRTREEAEAWGPAQPPPV